MQESLFCITNVINSTNFTCSNYKQAQNTQALLRSLHSESEFFACSKINTTSRCDSHVYTLPPKLSSVTINLDQVRFSSFFAFILIGKDEEYEKTEKRMRKCQTPCAMAFIL